MAYATQQDLENRLGGPAGLLELFDRDGNGVIDAALLAAALEYAEAVVDAELRDSHGGARFDDPGPVPALIKDLTAQLAIGYAEDLSYARRNTKREPGTGFTANALALLDRISKDAGARLPSGAPAEAARGFHYITAPAPIFDGTWADDEGQVYTTADGSFWQRDRGGGGGWGY